MDQIRISRKVRHKRIVKSELIKKMVCELIWNRLFWGIFVSVIINLATYSYITNNYMSIVHKEEIVYSYIKNNIITTSGIGSIEQQKFDLETSVSKNEHGAVLLHLFLIPLQKSAAIEDYDIVIHNERMNANNITIESSNEGPIAVQIFEKGTNELVNNVYSIDFGEREETQLREILIIEPNSNIAKWFLDTFK